MNKVTLGVKETKYISFSFFIFKLNCKLFISVVSEKKKKLIHMKLTKSDLIFKKRYNSIAYDQKNVCVCVFVGTIYGGI